MSISSIKREAKSLMKGNFIQLFLFVILPLLVGGIFSSWSTQANGFLYVLFAVLYLLIALFVQYNTYNWITTQDQDLLSFSGLISLAKNPHVLTTQLGIELIIILLTLLLFIPFVNIIALVALIVVSLMLVPANFIAIDKLLEFYKERKRESLDTTSTYYVLKDLGAKEKTQKISIGTKTVTLKFICIKKDIIMDDLLLKQNINKMDDDYEKI